MEQSRAFLANPSKQATWRQNSKKVSRYGPLSFQIGTCHIGSLSANVLICNKTVTFPNWNLSCGGIHTRNAVRIHTMTEEAAVRREVVPMSVLIVDDEQTVREACAAVTTQSGMKAMAVATAEEALEVLEHSAVDILLTDLKLPRTGGVELLKLVHDL